MTNFKIPLLAWKLMRSPIKSQRERNATRRMTQFHQQIYYKKEEKEREKEEGGEEGTFRQEDA